MTRAVLATVVLAFASSVATADTITVCLDGSCDYTDIQEAINAASNGDVIEIAAGTYYPAATIDTIGKAVTLRGVPGKGKDDAPTTVVDGQDSIRVLQCSSGEGADTVFENLLITGGYTSGVGGGMYNSGSSPTLENCTFSGNSANSGGGMYNFVSNPTLTDCTFTGNSAVYGGGMRNNQSSPTLTNCTFTGNSASQWGGGMYNESSSSPTLTNTILCSNTPDQVYGSWTDNGDNCLSFSCADDDGDGVPDKCGGKGGVILLVPSEYPTIESAIAAAAYGDVIEIAAGAYQPTETLNTQGKPITLRGAVDKDGQPATIIDGQDSIGVLQCSSGEGADTVFENLIITGGSAYSGGGMFNYESSPTLTNCTFQENSAYYGGGMYNYDGSSPTLMNCTFEGNSATNNGGGMYNDDSSPTLTNSMVCGNTSGQIAGSWKDNGGNCIRLACQDTNGDGQPDCEGTGTDDYLSVPSEYATIELAIDAAAEGALIDIAAGTYVPTVSLDTLGKAITLRGAIDGEGNPTTIIDGQDSIRVLRCSSGEGADTVFENLLITGGNTSGSGGGMYNQSSSPTLINCTFEGNSVDNYGGGMFNHDSSPRLTDCTFQGNSATGTYGRGGGMYNVTSSSPMLTGCTFEGNSAVDDGGGMYNQISSPMLTGCTFTGNSVDRFGGGMANWYASSPTLENCVFEGNSANDLGSGGGMYNFSNSSPTLTGCVFKGNYAVAYGGGMANWDASSPTLVNCSFVLNEACYGGGVYCMHGDPTFVGCTIQMNDAYCSGPGIPGPAGGIWIGSNSDPVLENCAICGNSSGQVYGSFTDKGGNCVQESCDDCDLSGCPSDFNGDGEVNGGDLGVFLIEWGECAGCAADFNDDGFVDGIDLGLFLVAWGPCP